MSTDTTGSNGALPQTSECSPTTPVAKPGVERGLSSPCGQGYTPFQTGSTDSSGRKIDLWYLDRIATLGASAYAAHRGIAGDKPFLTALDKMGTVEASKGSPPKGFLLQSLQGSGNAKMDLVKVLGGSLMYTTLADMTLFRDRTTSWKTVAVDVATPLATNAILGRTKMVATLASSLGAHAIEKSLFEDKKR